MSDRLTKALTSLVRSVMSPTDWHAMYPARVIVQHGDGTLDVQPDDSRLPGLTEVPIRLGLPGVSVKVSPGARVLIAFEGGDPSLPIASLWEQAGIEEIRLAEGVASVARVGDKTVGHTHTVTHVLAADPVTGVVTGTITINSATDEIAEGADKVKA